MFGHPKPALGQIEHLPFLLIDHAAPVEIRAAMPASRRSVFDHGVGFDDLPQRVALVALLSPARLARARAQTAQNARLPLQPVARRRLRAVGAVQPETSTKLRVLRSKFPVLDPKRLDLASEQGDLLFEFGRKNHSSLESQLRPKVSQNSATSAIRQPPLQIRLTRLGSYEFKIMTLQAIDNIGVRQTG